MKAAWTTVGTAAALLLVALALPLRAAGPAAEEEFSCTARPLPDRVREQMTGRSWSEGCPVKLDDLALLEMTFWGYDDQPHRGVLVVHRALAGEVEAIFRELYEARFPVERMVPYEAYDVGTYAAHNDTVGFYYRPAQEDPSRCSVHGYGLAVDINPLANPFLDENTGWWPEGSADYSSREEPGRGKILLRSKVFEVFTRYGWIWGGTWERPDYMHFEKGIFGSSKTSPDTWYFVKSLQYGGP